MQRAAGRPADMVRVIEASGAAVSHTGDTAETTIKTVTLPICMGANSSIRITTLWSMTNSANNKTMKVKFGTSSYLFYTLGSGTASFQAVTTVRNRNATNSQVGHTSSTLSYSLSSSAVNTSAIDTTAAVNITFTAQLALGTETITLEAYSVELVP